MTQKFLKRQDLASINAYGHPFPDVTHYGTRMASKARFSDEYQI